MGVLDSDATQNFRQQAVSGREVIVGICDLCIRV
jgi:hypothetical protein